jgi:methanogenic corrinoid protein MtbC1
VLLAAIGGEAHRGELSRVADALDRAGFETVYLGTDVHSDELEKAAGMHRPGAVCLNSASFGESGELESAVNRLSSIPEPPVVIVGGGAAETRGAIAVSSDEDAVEVLDHELAARAR